MQLLAAGRPPTDVPLSDLASCTEVSKGSFYAHFPGGLDELHQEVLARWTALLQLQQIDGDMRAVRDPADRIRLLLERALAVPGVPGAMQRWAAASAEAAAAVAQAQEIIGGHATQALADMGLAPADAALVSRLLVRAFLGATGCEASTREELGALVTLVQRAAGAPTTTWRLQAVALDAPDSAEANSGIILYPAPGDLSADERRNLAQAVQAFVDQRRSDGGEASNGGR